MAVALLELVYSRLGRRYLAGILAVQAVASQVVVAAGVLLLTLYEPLGENFWRIFALGQALMMIENLWGTRWALVELRPADAWLQGERDRERSVAAWHALSRLPSESLRRWKWWSVFGNLIPFCVLTTLVLELPPYGLLTLLAGGTVVLIYGLGLRFLALELAMRPVLERVADEMRYPFELGRSGIPLRWKLLLGLPLINVISGAIVAALASPGASSLEDLGPDVAIAVAVAFTVSLELTLLLSRSILMPIDSLREATERVEAGDYGVRVPVLSNDETGCLTRDFNEMVEGLQERERLRDAFGAFVDPEVAERVLREGTALEGEELEVTVLFVDIRDFTALAERSSAREIVARLNEFYELVVPALRRHGGHANKFIGDGLLGVFGAPDRQADHADRGVAAALEIARLVREHFAGRLRIGIGVNSGPVVAGTVGGGGRVEFTVIGDPVNTAARVEEVTRRTGDEILITDATRCLLREDLGLSERPHAELKGKRDRVRLWAPEDPGVAPLGATPEVPATT
jgi:adenylate cyclase